MGEFSGNPKYLEQYLSPISGGAAQSSGLSLGQGMGGGPAPIPGGMNRNGGSGGGSNPFSALFDPSRSGLTGLIGRAVGNPTREEWLAERAGGAAVGVMGKIQEAIAAGKPPQQAVAELINTPEGMEFFTSTGDPVGQLKEMMGLMVAKPKEDFVMNPGDQLRSGADPTQIIAQNPTGETQQFLEKAQIARLSDDEMADLARAQLLKTTTGDPSQAEAAVTRLVESGALDPTAADKILAGAIQVMPIRDRFNDPAGHVVIDITDPNGGTIVPLNGSPAPSAKPGDPGFSPGVTPGSTPNDLKNAGPGAYLNPEDPGDLILGAGFVPTLTEAVGGVVGAIVPQLTPEQVNRRRNAIRAIMTDAQQMRGASEARGFSADVTMIDGILNKMGILGDPLTQGQALIDWHGYLNQRASLAAEQAVNPNTSPEQRGKAEEDLQSVRVARRNLPDPQSIIDNMEEFRQGAGQIKDIETEAGKVGDVLSPPERTIPNGRTKDDSANPTFSSTEALEEAIASGKVKYGQRVRLMYQGKYYDVDVNPTTPAGE